MIVNGIDVKVTKKDIKNLHLYVKPPDGKVEVTCPLNCLDESIALFVRTRISWIKRKQSEFSMQPRQSVREYVSGETYYLWGKQYFLVVNYDKKSYSIAVDKDQLVFTVRENSTKEQRESVFKEWIRNLLKKEIEKTLSKWEETTGLYASNYQIRNMLRKWGTCSQKTRKITLNLQLVTKRFLCLEYVILHELAHLKENTHDKNFIAIMNKYMPNWREIKKQLNASPLNAF